MRNPLFKFVLSVLFVLLVSLGVSAQETTWNTEATHLRGQNGQRVVFYCPAGGTIAKTPWERIFIPMIPGVRAAVHAGLITVKHGGRVMIEVRPGAQTYQGTTRYGVTSRDYGGWSGSYVFVKEDVSSEPVPMPIKWDMRADGWRGQNGTRFYLYCPSGGTLARAVWGTDLYTDDSGICVAAVHAGLITMASGGAFTIEIREGAESYSGSSRRGITTSSYGGWKGSFVFVK